MREKVEVNKEVIKNEIFNLKTLLNTIISINTSNVDLKGKGYTKDYMDRVNFMFDNTGKNFQALIEETINLLENIEDGYADMDDSTAKGIERFICEAASNG